jgi:AcrR family transcriptional regulator
MTTPPRKRLSRAERRDVIEAAAAKLFARSGFEATRLEDVAAEAGVTKQLLYQHFSGKTELYLALLERHQRDLRGFADAMPATGSLEERLRAVAEVWIDYVETHSHAWRMLFRDSGGGERVQAVRAGVHDEARAVLADLLRALSAGGIPGDEIEPLAETLSMGQAALVLWWLDRSSVARPAIVGAIVRLWLGALTARPAGRSPSPR